MGIVWSTWNHSEQLQDINLKWIQTCWTKMELFIQYLKIIWPFFAVSKALESVDHIFDRQCAVKLHMVTSYKIPLRILTFTCNLLRAIFFAIGNNIFDRKNTLCLNWKNNNGKCQRCMKCWYYHPTTPASNVNDLLKISNNIGYNNSKK